MRTLARLSFAIALISAAALAYQLLLMRWLAIAHWHPFAVMIISLALLGHGASGTWLSLLLPVAQRRFEAWFASCAALFALSAVAALWLAQRIAFNGLELVWNARQLLWLAALYLSLALPFLFAASCFGLAFARHGERIPALYGADLLGAGVGALTAVGLAYLPVERGLLLAALCGPLAAALVVPRHWRNYVALAVIIVGLLLLLPGHALAPPVNEFKGLAKTLLLRDARVLAQRHGPYGWLTVVESPRVPLRYAPGLSLGNTEEPPPQLALYSDGDGLAVIDWHARTSPAYLSRMTSALPYQLRKSPRVLVLGAGGGQEVLQALALGARSVDAVELNPQRLRLLQRDLVRYSGDLFNDARVRVHVAEPRAFVRASAAHYDLIVLGSGESSASGGAGVSAAAEQYALTVQAVRDYHARLAPDGVLAITRWSKQPPRDELKLFATTVAALRGVGVAEPGQHVTAVRNWDASTLLLKRSRFGPDDVAALRAFADAQGFDLVHAPGMRADEANRFHVVAQPYLFEGAQALLSADAAGYLRRYKFAIAPATDDRPYFGNFFRWRSLPELWRLREQGSAVLLDSGYLLLLVTLVQALPLALLLVLVPLVVRRRVESAPDLLDGVVVERSAFSTAKLVIEDRTPQTISRIRAAGYFIALGLAFLLIEIASLSRLNLLVGHPLIAASVGLSGFLIFAGAGSVYAQRLLLRAASTTVLMQSITRAVIAIGFGLLWQFIVFTATFDLGAAWPVPVRAAAGLLGIAPLAFAMGLPFPLGLVRLAREAPAFVPWAWGLNGCASVIAAILALLLAMAIGLRATLLAALALYAFAAWVWRAAAAERP